jgi:TolA-binding protein
MLRDYPESDSSASAAFRLGEALFGQSRGPDFDQEFTISALKQWESYQRNYPGHWLQGEAARRVGETRQRLAAKLLKTGNLYLKLRLGDPARAYFQRIIDEYPETPQAGEATLGLALSAAVSGRTYEAIERLKQIETEFAGQTIAARAARERARLEN